ncbi:F-box/LRR-repeat protein At3g48880-like [Solanum dulcamara]|uniref:F-box/LRR-repeat protein At3g48880-like n=1 Tax=Solanum dulcamara TaxID=45834 RepID=UPI002486B4AD|nr:F-box/LRR-repeat protein At3g48880-like [Solanum dulcamara]
MFSATSSGLNFSASWSEYIHKNPNGMRGDWLVLINFSGRRWTCRCPLLKRLVMPAWDKLEKPTIRSAIGIWKDLESLTMPSIEKPADVIKKIARNCKKFSELKIMGPCEMLFASTLVSFLPNLEVLSVRCTVLCKPALVIILEGLKKLKVLNISHCIITEDPPPTPMKILTKLDKSILEEASRLHKFLTFMNDSYITWQRTRNDEGLMRWYNCISMKNSGKWMR